MIGVGLKNWFAHPYRNYPQVTPEGFSPPVKYIYWPFQGGTSFVFFLSCVCYAFARLSCLFIDAFWSPADLLFLVCDV